MVDLSIIIPIYNTPAPALERCLASLESLEGIQWEAILVDDGSGPQVGQLCRQYQAQHPRLHYFYKENGGVSSARNLGMEKADGTYIMFVDADDVLLGEPVVQHLQHHSADLTVFDMLLQEKDKVHTWYSLPREGGDVDHLTFLRHLLSGKSLNSPCVKLFRRSLIRSSGLRFNTDYITGEDWLFVTEYSLLAQSFHYVRHSCYRYFREEATGSSRLARFPDTMLANNAGLHAKRLQVIRTQPFAEQDQLSLQTAAAVILTEDMFNSAAELLLCKLLTGQRRQLILDCVSSVRHLFGHMPMKTRLKAFVLLHFFPGLWLLAKLRQLYLKLK